MRASVAITLSALSFLGLAPACRKDTRNEPAPPVLVPPALSEPAGLLFAGAIRHPAAIYTELQRIAGGRAQLLPGSLSVAIAATLFDAPLSAGLLDDAAPAALAVLRGDGDDAFTVAALRLTSGRELVAALTTGSDAQFTPRKDASGVTVLSRKTPDPRIAAGVYGDRLLLSDSEPALLAAGPFLARAAVPASDGADIELVSRRAALEGPLASVLRSKTAALREASLAAEAVARQRHGGRAPDFGEPSAVVQMLSRLTDGFVDVVASGAEARLTATLSAEVPVARVELAPRASGAARELTDGLATGTLESLLTLPDWVQAALFSRASSEREHDAGAPWAERFQAVLGDRLAERDRTLLRAWLDDAFAGLGRDRIAGVFDDSAFGAFAVGTAGNGAALRRATLALPRVAARNAVAEPLRAFLGRVDFAPAATAAKDVAALTVRMSPERGNPSRPASVSVVTSSSGDRVAVLAARDEPAQRIRDLLSPDATHTLAHDMALVSAVGRAGAGANAAAIVRIRDEGGDGRAIVLTFGSDRKVTWVEVGASKAAARMLVRAWIGP